ncbi:hypothetical protein NECAME_12898 [Necator americanus]|uniref:Uncharacterized protein n=1 Tax=Necator americanus TaxID=51031 RepID=W2SZX8_NECAM|nr:hypothetical protein NECAME_12898 [Necator americanus]ETN74571.1 hypothetical protein NECAME_12898 [Necator americanus]
MFMFPMFSVLDNEKSVKPSNETTGSSNELPSAFSLLSPLLVPLDISSSELMEMCSKRIDRPSEFKPIFCEKVPSPQAPDAPDLKLECSPPSMNTALLRPTPLVVVESRKDAQAPELQRLCRTLRLRFVLICPLQYIPNSIDFYYSYFLYIYFRGRSHARFL